MQCKECNGSGRYYDDECLLCGGTGIVETTIGGEEEVVEAEFDLEDEFEGDGGALAPYTVVDSEFHPAVLSDEQWSLIKGEVPVECTKVVPVGKSHGRETFAPYIPINSMIDIMNKLFAWRWHLDIQGTEQLSNPGARKDEVRVWGELVIEGQGYTKRIYCDGGAQIKKKLSTTMADYYKTARADMLKNGARWLGIGLGLGDGIMKERALAYHAASQPPEDKDLGKLKRLCGAKKLEQIPACVTGMEPWEIESGARVEYWIRKLQSSQG